MLLPTFLEMRKALPPNPTTWTCLFEGGYPCATCVGCCEASRADRSMSLHPLSSYHRSKQGHSCEEPSSDEYGGYTAFSHTVCRWRHSTALAIYYSESIFRGYEKDSWLYSPFQEVIKKGRVFHRAQWIITWCLCPRFGLRLS